MANRKLRPVSSVSSSTKTYSRSRSVQLVIFMNFFLLTTINGKPLSLLILLSIMESVD